MKAHRLNKPVVPARVLVLSLIPFAAPVLVTITFLLIAGSSLPRDIAPGSGLKLAGLLATLVTTGLAWRVSVQGVNDARVRNLAGVLCILIGLMGWPVWSVGALPFVNALSLQNERTIAMALDRTEATVILHSPQKHHWAWLTPKEPDAGIKPGRHFIPEATYNLWAAAKPETVYVQAGTGLLGSTVIISIR